MERNILAVHSNHSVTPSSYMPAHLNRESIYCPTNQIKISYLCQQNEFRRYETRGRPTRAAEVNGANGRRA